MDIKEKKQLMADKLYCQYDMSKGASPKYKQVGSDRKISGKYHQVGSGLGSNPKVIQAHGGRIDEKYSQAGKSNRQRMIVGHSKSSQKGKASLESVGRGEERMLEGKNETNRA